MSDYFDVLARVAQITIESEYYEAAKAAESKRLSLRKAILECKAAAIIGEIKSASPSAGVIRENVNAGEVAREMQRGGAVAVSVLTEPKQFNGSLEALAAAREAVDVPVIMKDIVLSPVQVYAAKKMGADAVLLIVAILSDAQLKRFQALATGAGLAALIEVHDEAELDRALNAGAELIGVNNRDLTTFKVDLATTERLAARLRSSSRNRQHATCNTPPLLVAESGIHTRADVERLAKCGAQAMLVGESLMKAADIGAKARELLGG